MLSRIIVPSSVDEISVPPQIASRIAAARARIEAFQDCWDRPQIEQFVAADYELVFQTIHWIRQSLPLIGQRFLEWGCGFAVVGGLASELGFDAIGIEAEAELLAEGRRTVDAWDTPVELIHGNFLPAGASRLAEDLGLPSLGHPVDSAYPRLGLDLDDFAIVYAYPWPGEDDFHELVFDRYAAEGSLLLLFCGPNEMRLWRKVT